METAVRVKTSVILPSYNPSERLISTVKGLIAAGFDDIILVDDGSRAARTGYMTEV